MTTCNRCGKAVGSGEWDIHTCTPKQESESNKAAYQRGYLDGMAKPCIECADRTWVGLANTEKYALADDVSRRGVPVFEAICDAEAKLKEKNT